MKYYIKADTTDILDEPREVQNELAWNPTTNSRLLMRLANSKFTVVREGVANNQNTPPEVLADLYHEVYSPGESDSVRNGALANPNIPADVLNEVCVKLFADWDTVVKYANIMVPLLRALASNPNLPKEYFQKLFELNSAQVYHYLARNPSTPQDIINAIYKIASGTSKSNTLITALASNPTIPKEMFDQIIENTGLQMWFRIYVIYDAGNYSLREINQIAKGVLREFGYKFIGISDDHDVIEDDETTTQVDVYSEFIPSMTTRREIMARLEQELNKADYAIDDIECDNDWG